MSKPHPHETCFYCGGLVRKNGVGDHFPLPFACGGEATVPCCESCHDMKDRFILDNWPVEWISKIMEDFPKLNRETKLFLAKAISVYAHSQKKKEPVQPPQTTTGSSAPGRV